MADAADTAVSFMEKMSYIYDGNYFGKLIESSTFLPAFGNFSYWGNCGAVDEYFYTLETQINSNIGNPTIDADWRRPLPWVDIEYGVTWLRGVMMYRHTMNNHDNVKIMKRSVNINATPLDDKSYLVNILSAVGATEENLLGRSVYAHGRQTK